MTDSDRNHFDQGLDALAKVLRVSALDSDVKFGYFKALRHYSISAFLDGCQKLTETYKPRRKDDFPVPAVFAESIGGAAPISTEAYQSRTYEQIKGDYRRRGILMGDEARELLEAEQQARKQQADESWQTVGHSVLGKEPF